MNPDRDTWLRMSDEELDSLCRLDFHRASGHGGQHVNRTDSAVRITHLPTGIVTLSRSSRNQHENRKHALHALRKQLALELRCEGDPAFRLPEVLPSVENPAEYPLFLGKILDLLCESGCRLKEVSLILNVSTSRLVKILHRDPELWTKVSRLRQEAGLEPLRFHG